MMTKRLKVLIACLIGVASLGAANIIGNLVRLHSIANGSLPASSTLQSGGLYWDSSFLSPTYNNGTIWQGLQQSLARHDFNCIMPGSATGTTSFGIPTTTVGLTTISTGGVAGFGVPSTLHRTVVSTSVAANQNAEVFSSMASSWRGDVAGYGGFMFFARFWNHLASGPTRVFVGLASTTAALPAADPNALLDTVYVGCNTGDTNLSICSNDGAGAATCTTLGASFPCISALIAYDVYLYAGPNASSIAYVVKQVNAATTASGTLSADLPTSTVWLAPHAFSNNSTSGVAASMHLSRMCVSRQF